MAVCISSWITCFRQRIDFLFANILLNVLLYISRQDILAIASAIKGGLKIRPNSRRWICQLMPQCAIRNPVIMSKVSDNRIKNIFFLFSLSSAVLLIVYADRIAAGGRTGRKYLISSTGTQPTQVNCIYMKSVGIIQNASNQALFLLKSNNSPSGKINNVGNSKNNCGNMRLIMFCMLSTDGLKYCSNIVSSGVFLSFFLTLVW